MAPVAALAAATADALLVDSVKQYVREAALTASIAAGLILVAFTAGGGQSIARSGPVLALLVLLVTGLFGRIAFMGRIPHPFSGFTTIALFTAYALWVALSIDWSILPDDSYVDAGRTLTYVAVFAAVALIAQLRRGEHDRLAGGLLIAALVICGYSLLSRVAPGWYSPADNFARLRAPFEYWNAVGVVAACGLFTALWLGTRRDGPRWLTASSFPAGVLLTVALLLSQSRGALVATLIGVALWLLLVARRLRSVGWLAVIGAFGAAITAWAFSQTALSQDTVASSLRNSTGWKFGLILVIGLGLAYLAGLGIEQLRVRRPLGVGEREQAGKALLIALAISPVLLLGALATTERGAWGTISDSVSDLTDSSKVAPGNTPDRLTQTSSLRARYWHDGFEVWGDHKLKGTGADTFTVSRLPYREDTLKVAHAHGFVPQTLADLGLIGMALALAALISWLIAAGRALGVRRSSPVEWLSEADDRHNALASLAVLAVVFGVHSAVDWTWYVPGAALFGIVAAGWVAGSARNADSSRSYDDSGQPVWIRAVLAAGILAIGISTMLSVYRPAAAANEIDDGYRLLAKGHPIKALNAGRDANELDHLADEPFYLIADAQTKLGDKKDAEKTLETIAARQPANPDTWLHLAGFRLNNLDDPEGALEALTPVLFLSPNSERGLALKKEADEALTQLRYKEAVRKARAKYRRALRKALEAGATGAPGAP